MAEKKTVRMTSAERRLAIIKAVTTVFARSGFHVTTSKELAAAAGVSEALLFKHFPNKEALYDAVIEYSANVPGFDEIATNRFQAMKPSTVTLITMVHFMISHFARCSDVNKGMMDRLAVQSLLADGEFLRRTIKKVADTWIRKFEDCVAAAREAGDLRETPVRTDLRFWFSHHVAFSLMLHHELPEDPALNYRASTEKLIEQAVWFALSGIGVKEEAIKRLYKPKELEASRP
jgi:AcrR family transcriptional regulator